MEKFDASNKLPRLAVVKYDGLTFKAGDRVFVEKVGESTDLLICGKWYSVLDFCEAPNAPLAKAMRRVKEGNSVKTFMLVRKPVDLKFSLGAGETVDIKRDKLWAMPLGGVITVGRNPQCSIPGHLGGEHGNVIIPFDKCVSHMHMIIYRDGRRSWRFMDCSSFGTALML